MSPEDTAAIIRQLDEVIGPIEGDDPKVKKRVQILDAATALFMRQGYRKTSMDEVAREAGVAKGTVYLYFTKKIDLALAAIGREKRVHLAELMDVFDDSVPAVQRFRRWMMAALLSAQRMPLIAHLMSGPDMEALMSELPPGMAAQQSEMRDAFLLPLLEEIVGPHTLTQGELRDRAVVMVGLGMLSPLLNHEHIRQGMTPERYAEILTETVLGGLAREKDRTP